MRVQREPEFSLRKAARMLRIDREKLAALCDSNVEGKPIVHSRVSWSRFRRRVLIEAHEIERVRTAVLPQLKAILEALEKERIGGIGGIENGGSANTANSAKNIQ